MKIYLIKYFSKPIQIVTLLLLFFFKVDLINAGESYFEEKQIETSTKTDDDSSVIPTNPFEIVEKIRRYNSLNDATNPSDAIDDALKLFNNLEEKEEI